MNARVSLTVIARDEAHNLPGCLGGLDALFCEIVLVDTGSRDATREVAATHGARVVEFPWCDSFAAARNAAIEAARGDWIFWLDADDRLDAEARDALARLLAGLDATPAVHLLPCRYRELDGRVGVVEHARLFPRRDDIRFVYRVHEQVAPAALRAGCVMRRANVTVEHAGYADEAARTRSTARNLRLLEMNLAESPEDPFLLFYLGWHHYKQDDAGRALRYLDRAAGTPRPAPHGEPPAAFLGWLRAECQRREGRQASALATAREGLRAHPDDPDLALLAGTLIAAGGGTDEALPLLESVLAAPLVGSLAQPDPEIRRCLARERLAALLAAAGDHDAARRRWRESNERRPDYLPAWLSQVDHAAARRDGEALREVVERSAASPAGRLVQALVHGRALMHTGHLAEARRLLAGAADAYPASLQAQELLSHVLLRSGAPAEEAAAALRRVLALAPHNAGARRNLELLTRGRGAGRA